MPTLLIVLFQCLNYHIALKISLNYIHVQNMWVFDHKLSKKISIF